MADIGKKLALIAAGVAMTAISYAAIAINGVGSVPTPAERAAVVIPTPTALLAPPAAVITPQVAAAPAAPAAAKPAVPQATPAAPAAAPVKVAAAPAAAPTAPAAAAPAAAGGAPDPEAGKVVFAKCKACHNVAPDGKNGVGPGLYGVVNRPAASVAGFAYSDGMKKKAGETWTGVVLFEYLKDPKGMIKGTKMAFAGLPSEADRANIIAYLAQNSATPIQPADLGLPGGGAAPAASAAAPAAAAVAAAAPAATAPAAAEAAAPAETPAEPSVVYTDPPPPTPEDIAKENLAVAAVKQRLPQIDYQRAAYGPIHFKPLIDKATNGECLACHQEVLGTEVLQTSPAGVQAVNSLAWYQTLATYQGDQQTFHQRHLTSAYAKEVMDLKCTFCHQGNDPREESPHATVAPEDMKSNNGQSPFTNRKMVNVSETCLRCHGAMPDPVNIMGQTGPWPEVRGDLENDETPNGCLTCHQDLFRTNRHNVTYLKAKSIEEIAKTSSDVCYGCHGGRAWYRISYPYARHSWPGMDTSTTPDWAKNRPTESDPRYQRSETK